MRKFVKTAMLGTLGLLLVSHNVQAAYVANDLILGFNSGRGTGPNDYIIDLGNANTAVGVGGTAQVVLPYNSATFNSLYGSLSGGVSMSVVGGNSATSGRDLYMTVLRSAAGDPSLAGSVAPTALASTPMANGVNQVGLMVNNLGLSVGGSATVAQSDPNSVWNNILDPLNPNTFVSKTGRDPSGSVASGSVLYEDLYRAVPNGAFNYLGYFTLDTSGGSLVFTPSAFVPVPEPASYGLFAGLGLLALTIRRQLKGQLV